MRKLFLLLFVLSLSIFGISQNNYKSVEPQPLSHQDEQLLLSLPDLIMPESYKSKSIPYKVDHSESPHFRDMFAQSGMSCGQASSTGICFTYEMNAARDLNADVNSHLYPTGFVYNWDAGDWGSSGVSYYHTLEVLRMVGTPNQEEYGGTIDAGGNLRWMTGYNLYYSAMHNRISHAYKINVGDENGLLILKNWMNDHLTGDEDGGCAIFYSTVPYPDATLPAGTEDAGKQVITSLSASTSHSMAILGYNDSIRYDYNGDGQYTNNIDITGDGQVTMADWEIGGIKMCNTYSGGPTWADGGFCYIMYKAIATGAFWHDVVHVMTVNPTYNPLLTAKVNITYSNRKRIKVYAGIATNPSASVPEYVIDFPILDYQGGDRPMTGGSTEIDKTIEFGLDLTPLLNMINPNAEAKYFIQVYENDADGWGTGTLNSFSLINYSSGSPTETVCTEPAQTIPQNGIATLSIISSENYDPVEITTTELSTGAIMSPFSQQLTAEGGTEPYTWSFDMDFNISESISSFPAGGTSLTGSGFIAVPLGFDFNYYGNAYNTMYVSNTGLVVFESGFSPSLPYLSGHDEIVFIHTRCIAPLYCSSLISSLKTISEAGYKTIIWDNATIDFSMTIFDDGKISFAYDNSVLTNLIEYSCGVSNGDEKNFQKLHFDNPNSISPGFTYTLIPFEIPEEFEISKNGLLTGFPTVTYLAEDFHFKVIDNNGLTDKKTLPFVTDGLILSFETHTPDDNIIEYAETVTLDVTATNPLVSPVTGIEIVVSTSDPYITITDNTAVCPDLNAGNFSLIPDAFSFNVSPLIPDNYSFQLNFTVSSDQDTWQYYFNFNAFAPHIEHGEPTVDDGNDNILAVNETADIILAMTNTGGSDVHNLVITASTTDEYITINEAIQNITALEPTEFENVVFNITSADDVPNQHIAIVNIEIAGDNGFLQNLQIELVIHTAIITVLSNFVNDGDNNCLDPGETSDVIFTVKNIGLVEATNLTITLTTEDPLITINTAPIAISELNAGNSEPLTFNISVDPDCDMAHFTELHLNVVADHGLNVNLSSYLIIGILQENWESGGFEVFEWTNGGDEPWYIVTDNVYEGTYSLKSGNIGHSQQSVLEIDMFVVADGEISFARKVSSENNYDFFEFLVDDVVKLSLCGEIPWGIYSYNVTTGLHNFKWRYRKDFMDIGGLDAAWIDNITFPAVNNIPPVLSCPVSEIHKTMNTNQLNSDPLTISNIGGGVLSFDIDIIPVGKSTKNIEGTTLTANIQTFLPGNTYDVIFTLSAESPDYEWIKTLNIDFPDEVIVNSSTDLIGPSGTLFSNNALGTGADLVWTTTETWGQIHQDETATCTVNITFDDSYTGLTSSWPFTISGDIYGSEPHSVSSEFELNNENSFWLSISPMFGEIPYNSDFELSLLYNTTDMAEGVYYADIKISDSESSLTIPVELTIDFTAEMIETNSDVFFDVYPNPFYSNINVSYLSEAKCRGSIFVYDITGKTILNPVKDCIFNKGKNTFSFSIDTNLSEGIYLIKVVTENAVLTKKIIKH
ncbi:MAG TPA: T9SS type A sorting domain-containing protein [Bacteroidales bacterium]|nr:T9SS type A sorting domain-containing protein [Bacteroidales bacterium]